MIFLLSRKRFMLIKTNRPALTISNIINKYSDIQMYISKLVTKFCIFYTFFRIFKYINIKKINCAIYDMVRIISIKSIDVLHVCDASCNIQYNTIAESVIHVSPMFYASNDNQNVSNYQAFLLTMRGLNAR